MGEILVYDCKFGRGEIAKYLDDELPFVVERIYSKTSLEIAKMSCKEIFEMVRRDLGRFVGQGKTIVLANPTVALVAGEQLRRRFPQQKFVGCGKRELHGEIGRAERVFVLASKRFKALNEYQSMKAMCQETQILEPDCQKWIDLMDGGWGKSNEAVQEVQSLGGAKVVMCHPRILERRDGVAEMVNWRGELADMRETILSRLRVQYGIMRA